MEDADSGRAERQWKHAALDVGCVRGETAGEGLVDGCVELEAAILDTAGDAVTHFKACDFGTDGHDLTCDVATQYAGKFIPDDTELLDAGVGLYRR